MVDQDAGNRGQRRRSSASGALDYVFGRNTLIGVASLLLLAISGYATWFGMHDFILGVQGGGVGRAREIGGLSISTDLLIIVLVVALTFLMWLALRETFGSRRSLGARLVTLPLYLFLAIWSIGFGYGYWWSLIAGPEASQRGIQGQADDVRDAAVAVAARLEAVRARLDGVTRFSEGQMDREANFGGTCGIRSPAGRGPLFAARQQVTDQIGSLRERVSEQWLGEVTAELDRLNARIGETGLVITGDTEAERRADFQRTTEQIRSSARQIAERSNALGRSFAAEMRQVAAQLGVEPGADGFSCFDLPLATLLSEAAEEANQPAVIVLRDAEFTEGAAGVANAVLNLWTNLGAFAQGIGVMIVGEDVESEGIETEEGEPITGRDLIALLATLGVDLGLFALLVLNPPTAAPARRDSLDETVATLYEPSETTVRELSTAIRNSLEITAAEEGGRPKTLEWVRLHFFNHLGYSYFVIPSLAETAMGQEGRNALAINQLAGVFSKLHLVQALDRPRQSFERSLTRRLSRRTEEQRWLEALNAASTVVDVKDPKEVDYDEVVKETCDFLHTTGRRSTELRRWRADFIAKARHALAIAGWSESCQRRPELFFVYYKEGIEPLIAVLERGEDRSIHEEMADDKA